MALDWEELYRDHGPALLRYLRRLARSQEHAEDLMQETFVRAMRAASDPVDPRAWLFRIATNVMLDHLRRERRLVFVRLGPGEAAAAASDELGHWSALPNALNGPAPSVVRFEVTLPSRAVRVTLTRGGDRWIVESIR